jgi:peptide/nickel transport system substrate-binding protein
VSITRRLRRTVWLLLIALAPMSAGAQDLRIALDNYPSSIDPLFNNLVVNNIVRAHVFDRLLHVDTHSRLVPDLAEAWQPLSDTEWEFRLRAGVVFHDGTPLSPDDVALSIDRADKVPNSPSSFAMCTADITGVEITGPLTLRLHTKEPDGYLPRNLSAIAIMARHAAAGRATHDFNTGTAAIGTGPYRFVSWDPSGPVVLRRNEHYWARLPDWTNVTLLPITVPAPREVALLTNEVDVIQTVPPVDVQRLGSEHGVRLVRDVPIGAAILSMDQFRDSPPFVTDSAGRPLERNPFKDRRVRLALSRAIDRNALVSRILADIAVPAGQMVPEGSFGFSPRVQIERYDPALARALLAEAGYPDGFRVTLHANGDTGISGMVAQAIAQMLSRVGVRVSVETPPASVFFARLRRGEFALAFSAWLSNEMSYALKGPLATVDPVRGWGSWNHGQYSNPAMDALLVRAQGTLDDTARAAILAEASETAMADVGVIPLYHQVPLWGMRKGLTLDTSASAPSLAASIHPARPDE